MEEFTINKDEMLTTLLYAIAWVLGLAIGCGIVILMYGASV